MGLWTTILLKRNGSTRVLGIRMIMDRISDNYPVTQVISDILSIIFHAVFLANPYILFSFILLYRTVYRQKNQALSHVFHTDQVVKIQREHNVRRIQ